MDEAAFLRELNKYPLLHAPRGKRSKRAPTTQPRSQSQSQSQSQNENDKHQGPTCAVNVMGLLPSPNTSKLSFSVPLGSRVSDVVTTWKRKTGSRGAFRTLLRGTVLPETTPLFSTVFSSQDTFYLLPTSNTTPHKPHKPHNSSNPQRKHTTTTSTTSTTTSTTSTTAHGNTTLPFDKSEFFGKLSTFCKVTYGDRKGEDTFLRLKADYEERQQA